MNTNIQTALLVFLVGMTVVFIVLCIVVLTGKTLIYLVNKFGPVSSKNSIKKGDFIPLLNDNISSKSGLNKKKLAAIISTVEIVTQGRGKVLNIEKVAPK